MTHEPWAPPEPPAPFSVPPGRSVVIPDEPSRSRNLVALIVVGCLAAVALAGGVLLLTHDSDSASTSIDSEAITSTSSSTTTTTVVTPGGVEFLLTRSPVDGSGVYVDTSELSVGTCFNVKMSGGEGLAQPKDCNEEHFYQLFAVGPVPNDITEYSRVDAYWVQYCADKFARFVGVSYLNSRFFYSGSPPASWQFPGTREMTCFLYVPGEFGWIGSAGGSEQ